MNIVRAPLRFVIMTYFAMMAFNLYKNFGSRALDLAEHLQSMQNSITHITGWDTTSIFNDAFWVANTHLIVRFGSSLLFVVSVISLVFTRTIPFFAGLLYLIHKSIEHRFLDATPESATKCEPISEALSFFMLCYLITTPASPTPLSDQAKNKKAQ